MKIGILGAGQLARMLTLAAYPLGFQTLCIDPAENTCASQVTKVIRADYHDEKALRDFFEQVDVISYETENIPLASAEFIAKHRPLFPSVDVLKMSQDRFHEKTLFQNLKIPVADFVKADSFSELQEAVNKIGFPAVLKTRRFGYDGKGQTVLKKPSDLEAAWAVFSKQALILEQWIPFQQEASLIAVRNQSGDIHFYPLTRNEHREGILRFSEAPYQEANLEEQAQNYARTLLEHFNYIGVLCIEFFERNGKLIANEMAPRVHNSGHWTIEGAQTSQFENHVRAICHLPLGETQARGKSAMFNCIGEEPSIEAILKIPDAHYHSYGKAKRADRKLGHVTLVENSQQNYEHSLEKLKGLFPSSRD